MSKMLICIPSAGRADKQVTLANFRRAKMLEHVHVVVPEKQVARYRSYLGDNVQVFGEPAEHKGIGETRAWILQKHAWAHAYEYVLMLDDDMDFCRRKNVEELELFTIDKAQDLQDMVDQQYEWLKYGFVHTGISARQGNNRPYYNDADPRVFGLHAYRDATRMMNAYAYNIPALLKSKAEFSRVPVMEDFDLTLQLLRKGLANRVSFEFCWNQRGSGASGGCSTYRTPAIQELAATTLKALHPDFVTVKMKKSDETSSSWKGFKERHDVNVQWRAAFDSSGKKLEG